MSNDPLNGDYELVRTKSVDELAAVVETLNLAGVKHRVSSTKAGFDISEVGRGDYPADMMVMVEREDVKAARAALEGSFTETPLPEDHFLHSSPDEEILEILAAPNEWDPFVVVHARRIARERDLKLVVEEAKSAEYLQALAKGKPAERWHVILGWISVVLGGVVGMWIGFSLAYDKDSHEEGDFYSYDAPTREMGLWMLGCGLASLLVWRLLIWR